MANSFNGLTIEQLRKKSDRIMTQVCREEGITDEKQILAMCDIAFDAMFKIQKDEEKPKEEK